MSEEKNPLQRIANGIAKVINLLTPKSVDKVVAEVNTLNAFVKVKANSFNIEKVMFSFVEFDQNSKKLLKSIDTYMSFGDALILSNDILSGKISRLATKEKAKGDKYPKAVYTSPLGGVSEEKAKVRKLRTDGKAISRAFTIAPGNKADFVFTAEQRAGKTAPNGIIVPEGNAETTIRVGCKADALKSFALTMKAHIEGYISAQYATNGYARKEQNNGK